MNVSVIIPNYNGETVLMRCLNCIGNQVRNNKDIIIIDNGSTDNSVAMVKKEYPDVTLICNSNNVGFAAAVNQGITYATSEFVVLLNNDAFAEPNFLKGLYECIVSDRNVFSASSKMLSYANPDTIDNAGDQFCLLGWAFKTGDGQPRSLYSRKRIIFSACAGAAIYRREVFERIGYFDEAFFAYLEDVDIGFRANLNGYKNVYCPEAEVLHIGSASTGSTTYNDFKVKISARNNVYLVVKNVPIVLLIVNLPVILAGFLLKYLFFWRKGFGTLYKTGLAEGIRTMGNVRREKFSTSKIKHYLRIQYLMIASTWYCIRHGLAKVKKNTRLS